jgi:hypothetical protein
MFTRTHLSVKAYADCLSFTLLCINTGRWQAASSLIQRTEMTHTNILHTSKRQKNQLKFRLLQLGKFVQPNKQQNFAIEP